jgi:hypothetical protein
VARYGTLFEGIDTAELGKRLYYPLLMVKKVCFIGILATYYDEPLLQTGMISSLNMIYAVYLANVLPSKTTSDLVKTIACEVLILMVELTMFMYAVDDAVDYLSEESRMNLGWTIIGMTGTIILIQLIVNGRLGPYLLA